MKSLKIIQKIAYVAWIVSLVLACFAFTAAGFMVLGALGLGLMNLLMEIDFMREILLELPSEILYASPVNLIAESIMAAGQGVVMMFVYRYFTNERRDGTPFTRRGAKEMMILGIITAAVPLVAISTSSTVAWIGGISVSFSNADDMALGLLMVFMSFIFRYGADLAEKAGEAVTPEAENKPAESAPAAELPTLTEEATDKEESK